MYSQDPNNDIIPRKLRQKASFQRQTQAKKCLETQQSFQMESMSMPRDKFDSLEKNVRDLIDNQITFDREMKEMYEDYWSQSWMVKHQE